MSPHEMKGEIETTHFEHTFAVLETNRAAEPLLTKQVEMCAFHHNLSRGFYRVMSVKFLFLTLCVHLPYSFFYFAGSCFRLPSKRKQCLL